MFVTRRRIQLLVCLLFITIAAHADWTPVVRHFTPNDYGAGTQNWGIIEQENGWIYAANNYGLLEFDGSRWQLYGISNSTAVRSVARGKGGDIYVGGTDEFGVFSPDGYGGLTYRSLSDSLPARYRQFGEVWKIHVADDALYVQSRNYVFICNLKGHIEVIDAGAVIYTSVLVDGNLYVATSRDVYVLNGNRLHALRGAEMLHGAVVCALLPYREHGILIATDFQGVYVYDGEQIRRFKTDADNYIIANQLYTIAAGEHCLAFGTVRRGVVLTDLDGKHCRYMTREDGLQNNTVLSMLFDSRDNLWMGLDNGMDMMASVAPVMYWHDRDIDYGSGYAACEHRGTLYLGTNQGLYALRQDCPEGGMCLVEGSLGQVWDVFEVGGTLFCSHNRGLFMVQHNRLVPLETGDGIWSVKSLSDTEAVAGSYTGFYYLYRQGNTWKIRHLDGFSETSLYYEIDATGHIWLLTSQGVERLTINKSNYHIDSELVIPQVAAERTYSLARLHDEIWLTSDNYCGIVGVDGTLRTDSLQACQLSGIQRYILLTEDNAGNIWYMYNGRFKVKPFDATRQTYGVSRELLHNPDLLIGGFANICFLSDGDAVIGGVDGFFRLNGKGADTPPRPETLYIRSIKTLQPKPVVVYGESYPLHARPLVLPADAYSLQVQVCGSDVTRERVLYRTRLSPTEQSFTDWQATPSREFIGLQSGQYNLDIEMLTRDDTILSRTLPIEIQTPFYQTIWARLVYMFVLLLVMLYISWRIYRRVQMGKQRIAQEKNEEIRQQQLRILQLENEKAQYDLQNKSRELSNVLLNEANRKEWNQEILNEIHRIMDCLSNDRLTEAKGRMQNLQNRLSRNGETNVDWKRFEENFDMVNNGFIERLKERYPWMSKQERKLCVYIKMGLINKEIAPLMNISVRGVEMMRYRLRTKMDLDSQTNLSQFFNTL